MQMGHAGKARLGPALSANWIRSERPGIAIPSQHPSPIPTTNAGGDCHGRSAVSPATRAQTTTRAERRRASPWRPEKAAPEDSGEGVPARLGTGEDAHGRSAAPPAARGSPAALVLGVGATAEVGAGRGAVGGAIHESDCLWAPCARAAGAAARRRVRQREAEGHQAAASACARWRRRRAPSGIECADPRPISFKRSRAGWMESSTRVQAQRQAPPSLMSPSADVAVRRAG